MLLHRNMKHELFEVSFVTLVCSLWKKVERNEERQWPHLIFDRSWELQEGRNTVVAFGPRDKELKSTPRARIAKRVAATAEVRRRTHHSITNANMTDFYPTPSQTNGSDVPMLCCRTFYLLCKYVYLVYKKWVLYEISKPIQDIISPGEVHLV